MVGLFAGAISELAAGGGEGGDVGGSGQVHRRGSCGIVGVRGGVRGSKTDVGVGVRSFCGSGNVAGGRGGGGGR